MTERKFGWQRQNPDFRDYQFKGASWWRRMCVRWGWPSSFDLTDKLPPVFDQGHLGSCVANATTAAVIAESKDTTLLSRLFLYFNARIELGPQYRSVDSGSVIRDALKSVVNDGSIPENLWPYEIDRFADEPPDDLYALAKRDLVTQYATVPQNLVNLRCALLEGYPIVFGISVFSSFMAANQGNIPMPAVDEQLLGGHAILLVGFDNKTERFRFRNSWGPAWGDGGYGWLPYDYVENPDLSADFWVVEKTTA